MLDRVAHGLRHAARRPAAHVRRPSCGGPDKGNPLRVKGGGEGGTTPAPAAVLSAVCDALASVGVERFEPPATPARIWAALKAARKLRAAPVP